MKTNINVSLVLLLSAVFLVIVSVCTVVLIRSSASWQSDLQEDLVNPAFDPSHRAYYPSVSYDASSFGGHGESQYYKMWYASHNGANYELRYVSSADGKTWANDTVLTFAPSAPSDPNHPVVMYDANGFGNPAGPYYKMWYWASGGGNLTPDLSGDIQGIWYAESNDGITWTNSQTIHQNTSLVDLQLNTGVSGSHFYHLYGPGDVLYNSSATNTGNSTPTDKSDDVPMSYTYVMYFDTSSEGTTPEASYESTALAYSSDGMNWIRYGSSPVIVPSGNVGDWDGKYIYRPSVLHEDGTYHMWYSGSDGPSGTYDAGGGAGTGTYYARGIGHATSFDGITWTLDSSNPFAYVQDGVDWRDQRTYTPSVIHDQNYFNGHGDHCQYKLYHTGVASTGSGDDSYNIIYWAINAGVLSVDLGSANPSSAIVSNDAVNIPLLQVSLSADSVESWNIASATFSTSGTIDESTDVLSAQLYVDSNANGIKDNDDILLQTLSAPSINDGQLVFPALNRTIAAGVTEHWLLTYTLSGTASAEETMKADLISFDASPEISGESAHIVQSLPELGNIMTIGRTNLWDPLEKTNTFEDSNANSTLDPGEVVQYTITIGNAGNTDATDAKFIDPLPQYTSFIEGSFSDQYATYNSDQHEVVWLGPLLAGETLTFSFKVRIDENLPSHHTLENKFTFYPDQNNTLEAYSETATITSSDTVASTTQAELVATSSRAWLYALVGGLIVLISIVAIVLLRRL